MQTRVQSVVEELKRDPAFLSCVTHWETVPARKARTAPIPEDVSTVITDALASRGIRSLYTHQRRCYEEARRGNNVVVVTPTASGKTLSYNLPVLQTLLERKEARALYLFPTKALSQDQQSALNEVVLDGDVPVKICTYDGDTPGSLRISARNSGRIIISNPDMLHAGVLPNHPKWIKFFTSLAYVVIDEIHTYRGVFGSHMTNLVRRLKRIAAFYGAKPVFICCSATIGNPKELAERILEEPAVLVDDNGAPSGEKHLVLYNPPLVDRVQGIRRGVVRESQKLAVKLLKQGVKTIVFSRSRVRTELIASYINTSLANVYTENGRIRVEAYRGGYLPSERRAVERGLRDGSIHGVVSTNALELGIDIGGLDAAVLAGFPGSFASTWQQAGRAGRTANVSLAILVASASPVDQYIVRNPQYFLGRSPESGWVDPENLYIMLDHLKCSVFELPYKDGDGHAEEFEELLGYLEEFGVIRHTEGGWYWADRSYPAESISLRSATSENVIIVDTTKGRNAVIGEMDRPSAKQLIFENAVYIHRGNQYIVRKLDIDNRRCEVEESTVNYFTDSIVKTDIKVLRQDSEERAYGADVVVGDVLVRHQVAKFKKLRYHTHENIGYGEISLPEEEMHTRSMVAIFRPGTVVGDAFHELPEDLRGPVIGRIGTLFRNVAPVFLLCDAGDIGVAPRLRDPHFAAPVLYVYDSYPGGTGLAEGFRRSFPLVLRAARDVVRDCPCEEGCPSCVGPREQGEEIQSNPKEAVYRVLDAWAEES
jgi:DEAD/DEAH box helicase domain-containing protein